MRTSGSDLRETVLDRLRAMLAPPSYELRPPERKPGAPPAATLRSAPDRPDKSDAGRLDPGPPGARALAIVGAVAALIAGGYLWWSRPEAQPAPTARPAVLASSASAALASPTPSASVVVHVAGKVRRPGVRRLPAGSRVVDAIEAAGGTRPGVDMSTLNLARRVIDGEQIIVGAKVPAGTASGVVPSNAGSPGAAAPLDLNAATVDQLQQLPGVGPVLAQRIVDFRTQHGGFSSVEQLRDVSGIGERRFADLKSRVRI